MWKPREAGSSVSPKAGRGPYCMEDCLKKAHPDIRITPDVPEDVHEACRILESWMALYGIRCVNGVADRRGIEMEMDAMRGTHSRLQESHVRLIQKYVLLEKGKHMSDMVAGLGRGLLEAQERRHKEQLAPLLSENQLLRIALADAIRRPMGVVPSSAIGLITFGELSEAERRRVEFPQNVHVQPRPESTPNNQ